MNFVRPGQSTRIGLLGAIAGTALLCGLLAPTADAQTSFRRVPREVLEIAGEILPEGTSGTAFVVGEDEGNLRLLAPCQISVTFLWESAGYRNSVGYFTWRENADGDVEVLDTDLLFPDVTARPAGPLRTGSTAWLLGADGNPRTFQAGDRVGFFLIADGFESAQEEVRSWTFGTGIPTTDPQANADIGRGVYTTIPRINPEARYGSGEGAEHVAMAAVPGVPDFAGGDDFVLIGFEDLDRTDRADEDFNDCVFSIHVEPPSAFDRDSLRWYSSGDTDGDGVPDVQDAFPDDPDRAYIVRYPRQGLTTLVFEDTYPDSLDGDYDDAVFGCVFVLITDARNRVKDILADFHLVGRGARYEHTFGLHVPRIPDDATGRVRLQRIPSSGVVSPIEERSLSDVVFLDQRRIHDVFPSTRNALPSPSPWTPFANTQLEYDKQPAGSARVLIQFDSSVNMRPLGAPPFDPYLVATATDGTIADIHLPGFPSFDDVRSPHLPRERGPDSFVDPKGNPWALSIPSSWRFPLEGVKIERAYPAYEIWRDSGGERARDWYLYPTVEPDRVSDPLETYIPPREWTLLPPGTP